MNNNKIKNSKTHNRIFIINKELMSKNSKMTIKKI